MGGWTLPTYKPPTFKWKRGPVCFVCGKEHATARTMVGRKCKNRDACFRKAVGGMVTRKPDDAWTTREYHAAPKLGFA